MCATIDPRKNSSSIKPPEHGGHPQTYVLANHINELVLPCHVSKDVQLQQFAFRACRSDAEPQNTQLVGTIAAIDFGDAPMEPLIDGDGNK